MVARAASTPVAAPQRGWKRSVYADLPTGGNGTALGVFPGGADEASRGPNMLVAENDGRVLIFDGENRRSVLLKGKTLVRAQPLKRARQFSDAAHLGDGRVVAFDADKAKLWMIDKAGASEPLRTPAPIENFKMLRVGGRRLSVETEKGELDVGLTQLPKRVQPAKRAPLPVQPAPLPVQRAPLPVQRAPLPIQPAPRQRAAQPKVAEPMVQLRKAALRGVPVSAERSVEVLLVRGKALIKEHRAGGASRQVALAPPVAGDIASVTEVGADASGRLFVRIEMLVSKNPIQVRRFIRILSPKLTELTTFEYPVEGVIIPNKDVDVDANGNVFILLPYADKVRILRHAAP